MIPRAMPARTEIPGRFNLAGLVEEERPDKGQPLALQVGAWAWGQSPHHSVNFESEVFKQLAEKNAQLISAPKVEIYCNQ